MIVELTAAAEADLEAIGDDIAQDNPVRALSFVQVLSRSCIDLANKPEAWPIIPRYERHGVRRRVHGRYLIFYRVAEDRIVVLHVPFRLMKRGGREEMQLPDGAANPRQPDNTLVKSRARAFRWKRMLESGEFATIAELAEREGITASYMTRVLRLTLLTPDIVETILYGKQGLDVALANMMETFPLDCKAQTARQSV